MFTGPQETMPAQPSSAPPAPKRDLERMVVTNPMECFVLENGMAIKSLRELIDYLPSMEDEMFHNHVGENYNHFADWVRGVFHDDALADQLQRAKTRSEMLAVMTG
jgi:hypothetical protein